MEAEFMPKVSIVIPVYNGANYLKQAIDCALAQTYPNVEVIVVNDGSCDDGATERVALSYGEKIRYFSKENGGVSSALNWGIRHMEGEYFSWLSHDDGYEPEKVAGSVAYLAAMGADPKCVAMCGAYYIDAQGRRLRNMDYPFEENRVYSGVEVIHSILKHGMLNACCTLIPKAAFEECGCFEEDLRYNQDALMWYRIFSGGYSLICQPKHYHVMYRLHGAQTSKTRRDLLLRDSYAMSVLIAPTMAAMSSREYPLLRLFALRHARHDCKDAVEECVRVGKEAKVLSWWDITRIRLGLLWGKCRNVLKKIYHLRIR